MSDEEKAVLKTAKENYGLTSAEQKILVNLIEKQSKEIEEYKKQLDLDNECEIALNSKVMDLEKEIEELKDTRSIFNMGRRSYKNEIEDKIKAKIEEVQNMKVKAKDIVFKSSLNYIETEFKSLLEKE